jgi:hypothetical protein
MGEISWQSAVEQIRPYVVRIATPEHTGTGFLFTYAADGGICGVATAAHAVAQANLWEQPIRLEHTGSGKERLLRPGERTIVVDQDTDTAAIVFLRDDLPLPARLLPVTPEDESYPVGVEIGWVGFPAVAREELCFFSGRISAWRPEPKTYLVDGVAINGVSGGPAFHVGDDGLPLLLGVVSAYLPNKAVGGALPGLSVVQHVGHLDKWVQSLEALEQGS